MLGGAVDQQRFQRREKIAWRIAGAFGGLSAGAKLRAQFLQHRRGTGNFGIADFQPLELDQKVAARQRCQPPQKISNPINQLHGTQFPRFYPESTRGAGARSPSTRAHAGVPTRAWQKF